MTDTCNIGGKGNLRMGEQMGSEWGGNGEPE